MGESLDQQTLNGSKLRPSYALDLLGDILPVDRIRQVAAGSERAQSRSLLLGPGHDVVIVETRSIHRESYREND
ncbi:hypothetical protein ADL19_09415 [Streptomyces purpurogeneiscleroticus]|nr:hypothetical protein ADL19_09415 [Streptomyces purpurogeneiscleroticus]